MTKPKKVLLLLYLKNNSEDNLSLKDAFFRFFIYRFCVFHLIN